eukprot:563833-Pyramimonas_sp.AAC.1
MNERQRHAPSRPKNKSVSAHSLTRAHTTQPCAQPAAEPQTPPFSCYVQSTSRSTPPFFEFLEC